jgi:hypothetical protein
MSGRRPLERPARAGASREDDVLEIGPSAREAAAAGGPAGGLDEDSGDDALADIAAAWGEAAAALPRRRSPPR